MTPCLWPGFDPTSLSILPVLASVVVPVTFGIIAVVGIIGNALVIIVVITNAQVGITIQTRETINCGYVAAFPHRSQFNYTVGAT